MLVDSRLAPMANLDSIHVVVYRVRGHISGTSPVAFVM